MVSEAVDLTKMSEHAVLRAVNNGDMIINDVCQAGVPLDRRPKVTKSRRKLAGSFKVFQDDYTWFTNGQIAFQGTPEMLKSGPAEGSSYSTESMHKLLYKPRQPWEPIGWAVMPSESPTQSASIHTPYIWFKTHDGKFSIMNTAYFDFMTTTLKVTHWEGSSNFEPIVGKRKNGIVGECKNEIAGIVMAFSNTPPPPDGIVREL